MREFFDFTPAALACKRSKCHIRRRLLLVFLQEVVDPLRLRKEYLRQYTEFTQTLQKECGAIGIDCRRVLTSDSLQQTLGSWLAEREVAQRVRFS